MMPKTGTALRVVRPRQLPFDHRERGRPGGTSLPQSVTLNSISVIESADVPEERLYLIRYAQLHFDYRARTSRRFPRALRFVCGNVAGADGAESRPYLCAQIGYS